MVLEDAITYQERQAAEHFIVHGVKIDAYRAAYSTENMKDATAHRRANEVFNRSRVQMYVLERQKAQAELFDMKVHEIKKLLATTAAKCLQDRFDAQGNRVPIDAKAAISALSEINRMNGNHAPIRKDIQAAVAVLPVDMDLEAFHLARIEMLSSDDC